MDHQIFSYTPGDDPDGSRGKVFFAAVIEAERWEAYRTLAAWLLILAGVPCWLSAAWPHVMEGLPRRLALSFWALLFLLFAYSALNAWRWRRALARFSAAFQLDADVDRK